MSRRKPYVRPMPKTWYLKNRWYTRYMLREATSVFITIYCLVLLAGLWALNQGPEAFQGWIDSVSSPLSIVFHLVALLMTLLHMGSWFILIPLVMPTQLGKVKMPSGSLIIKGHFALTAIVSLVFLALAL